MALKVPFCGQPEWATKPLQYLLPVSPPTSPPPQQRGSLPCVSQLRRGQAWAVQGREHLCLSLETCSAWECCGLEQGWSSSSSSCRPQMAFQMQRAEKAKSAEKQRGGLNLKGSREGAAEEEGNAARLLSKRKTLWRQTGCCKRHPWRTPGPGQGLPSISWTCVAPVREGSGPRCTHSPTPTSALQGPDTIARPPARLHPVTRV